MRIRTIAWKSVVALATLSLTTGYFGIAAGADDPPACVVIGTETLSTSVTETIPGDVVDLAGTGYGPLCSVTIRVSWDGGSDESSATTGGDGSLLHQYTVGRDGGIHTVDAIGANDAVLASASFSNDPIFTYASPADRTADIRRNAFERGDTVYSGIKPHDRQRLPRAGARPAER